MTEELCVCCGAAIPEGRQVCPTCEIGHRFPDECKWCGYLQMTQTIFYASFKCERPGLSCDTDTADVIKVVRCQKCVYANDDGTICRYSVGRDTTPNGYCNHGVRKGVDV